MHTISSQIQTPSTHSAINGIAVNATSNVLPVNAIAIPSPQTETETGSHLLERRRRRQTRRAMR